MLPLKLLFISLTLSPSHSLSLSHAALIVPIFILIVSIIVIITIFDLKPRVCVCVPLVVKRLNYELPHWMLLMWDCATVVFYINTIYTKRRQENINGETEKIICVVYVNF